MDRNFTSLLKKIIKDEKDQSIATWKVFSMLKQEFNNCECGCSGNIKNCRDKKLKENYTRIKEHIFFSNRKYANRISLLTMRKIPSFSVFDRNDAISCSEIGLLESIENFDLSFNVCFNTFSYKRIRGAVLDNIRTLNNFTTEIASARRMIMPRIQIITHILGKFPTLEDLKDTLTDKEFRSCLDPRFFYNVYNQKITKEEGEFQVISGIRRQTGVDEKKRFINKLDIDDIVENKFQSTVIFYYYYMGMPVNEISLILRKSPSTVSKAKTNGEEKIRKHFNAKSNMINFLYQE